MSACAKGQSSDDTSDIIGDPRTTKSRVLETGAAMVQEFKPVKQICAHLNAFHVYANDPTRCVESNHYCSHLTEDVRQCLIYDSPQHNARLIGVEYMVTPRVFLTLPQEERRLWHTHEFEVKSGMLAMPAPAGVPGAAWEAAETAEMKDIAPIYGKTYHFWQVDRGDPVPMGPPQLMGSFTSPERVEKACPGGMDELLKDRDGRFGIDYRVKAKKREGIAEHAPNAQQMERLLRKALKQGTPRRAARLALDGIGLFCACTLVWEHLITIQLSEGPSMYPTFSPRGDYLLISRMHRNGKGIAVGDVVRFNHPTFLGVHGAKRVVGMPGDFVCRDAPFSTEVGKTPDMIQVPEGHVFLMGDNLPWSRDSRNYGPVPMALINGKIVARVWPPSKMEWVKNTMQPAQMEA
ncbi:Peptidase S26A signal peptidase I [Penicillium riverlandense]|uniref:Peptidase S26A signal peptidase I n=1 Tax=Penicillium riverlandense TaxID=1903569 RepID=UPI0025471130|nr:Peptidase S26A signal peptidase I [Penicillium riverlandense]KAJ5832551.1 Peptidase S26A signal peptidase I [Penicillium riverlandense]